jgi:hypothetical protein
MNDKFLFENRPEVNQQFADQLYQKLTTRISETEVLMNTRKQSRSFKWQYALVALLITAVLLFTFSAPVRAKALELIRLVAGFNIQEQSESPLAFMDDPESTVEITVYPVLTEQLADLLKNPPFSYELPTWVPDGYTLNQEIGKSVSGSWISLGWGSPDGLTSYELLVEKEYNGYTLPAGEGSAEEITINGQPAYLVRGDWGADGQWDPRGGITIGWQLDGHFYRMDYGQLEPERYTVTSIDGDMDAILENMIKMAESVSPPP